jgi:large subunit ribosomal protein L3
MKYLIGKKKGMSQLFDTDEKVQPVTIVEAGPCKVTLIRTKERDGYTAAQLSFDNDNVRREFHISPDAPVKVGDTIDASLFAMQEKIHVQGITKGKGFQGGVKRHGMSGGPKSHGHRHVLRALGSVGSRFPQHVRKGRKMPGRMGGGQATMKSLEVLWVDPANNLIAVKGSIPGAKNGIVELWNQEAYVPKAAVTEAAPATDTPAPKAKESSENKS